MDYPQQPQMAPSWNQSVSLSSSNADQYLNINFNSVFADSHFSPEVERELLGDTCNTNSQQNNANTRMKPLTIKKEPHIISNTNFFDMQPSRNAQLMVDFQKVYSAAKIPSIYPDANLRMNPIADNINYNMLYPGYSIQNFNHYQVLPQLYSNTGNGLRYPVIKPSESHFLPRQLEDPSPYSMEQNFNRIKRCKVEDDIDYNANKEIMNIQSRESKQKLERRECNRKNAKLFRDRKRMQLDDLQSKQNILVTENKKLKQIIMAKLPHLIPTLLESEANQITSETSTNHKNNNNNNNNDKISTTSSNTTNSPPPSPTSSTSTSGSKHTSTSSTTNATLKHHQQQKSSEEYPYYANIIPEHLQKYKISHFPILKELNSKNLMALENFDFGQNQNSSSTSSSSLTSSMSTLSSTSI